MSLFIRSFALLSPCRWNRRWTWNKYRIHYQFHSLGVLSKSFPDSWTATDQAQTVWGYALPFPSLGAAVPLVEVRLPELYAVAHKNTVGPPSSIMLVFKPHQISTNLFTRNYIVIAYYLKLPWSQLQPWDLTTRSSFFSRSTTVQLIRFSPSGRCRGRLLKWKKGQDPTADSQVW